MSPIGPVTPGGGGGGAVSSVFTRTGAVVAEAGDYTAPQVGAGNVYNVQAYGAKGDGATNDTADIQAAITAAASGGDVYFPYTTTGYLCGALTLLPGVRLLFEAGAFLTATAITGSWVTAEAAKVHQGTSIINGTFIATAAVSTAGAVLDFSGVTSCPNLRIENNRIVNAPVHGIYLVEGTYTQNKKWIKGNSIEGYGVVSTGYGIYCDYIGSVEIESNYVYTSGSDDAIECGHSGPAWLGGLNAHIRASHNTCVNGQLQFPFSDYVELIGNTVVNNTIQNDTNTANNVTIVGNLVLNATPAAGYAGIRVAGGSPTIVGNSVYVTQNDGIATTDGTTIAVITGNNITSTVASGNSGNGINDGGVSSSNFTISGNVIEGTAEGFAYGVYLQGSNHAVVGNNIGTFNGISGGAIDTLFADNNINVGNIAVVGASGASSVFRDNRGYNPVGGTVPGTAFALPASGVAWTNNTGVDGTLYVTAKGTESAVLVNGVSIGSALQTGESINIKVGGTVAITYTSAPTLVFIGD